MRLRVGAAIRSLLRRALRIGQASGAGQIRGGQSNPIPAILEQEPFIRRVNFATVVEDGGRVRVDGKLQVDSGAGRIAAYRRSTRLAPAAI